MVEPKILCFSSAHSASVTVARATRRAAADGYGVFEFSSIAAGKSAAESALEAGELALLIVDDVLGVETAVALFDEIHARDRRAKQLLVSDDTFDGEDERAWIKVVPRGTNEVDLYRTIRGLLEHYELRARLKEQQLTLEVKNKQLESLSDIGVALAGSFDIASILLTTHTAATKLSDSEAVDVLYCGCDSINARPLWCPETPADVNLSEESRENILDALTRAASERGHEGTERVLAEVCTEERSYFPMTHHDELLGLICVTVPEREVETARLLSTLTLQAATALRNIHLTQERIHFERLSAMGRMVGSIVHDIRSPLTALRGYAGMLAGSDLTDKERKDYSGFVIEECDRLNEMVQELLEFTRGRSVVLTTERIALGPYLQGLAQRARRHLSNTPNVTIDLALGYIDEVPLDPERLERALWNVLVNAQQSMPNGGRITLRTDADPKTVHIEVADEGAGIPDEVRHRVFEPFFSYGKSEGIGLGMLIARKIVEEHGGSIRIESNDRGTAVRFSLPRASSGETSHGRSNQAKAVV